MLAGHVARTRGAAVYAAMATPESASGAGAKRDLDEEEEDGNEESWKRLRGDDTEPAPASAEEPGAEAPDAATAAPEEVSPLSLPRSWHVRA